MTFQNKKLDKPWLSVGKLNRNVDEQRPYPPHRVYKDHPFGGLFDLFDNVLYGNNNTSKKKK